MASSHSEAVAGIPMSHVVSPAGARCQNTGGKGGGGGGDGGSGGSGGGSGDGGGGSGGGGDGDGGGGGGGGGSGYGASSPRTRKLIEPSHLHWLPVKQQRS